MVSLVELWEKKTPFSILIIIPKLTLVKSSSVVKRAVAILYFILFSYSDFFVFSWSTTNKKGKANNMVGGYKQCY